MTARRCVVCLLFGFQHRPWTLQAHGLRSHAFDPGERRSGTERRQVPVERRAA